MKIFMLFEKDYYESYRIFKSMVDTKKLELSTEKIDKIKADILSFQSQGRELEMVISEGIAYIPVIGQLVNEIEPCAFLFGEQQTLYADIISMIDKAKEAMAKEIIFEFDTPGGHVSGCDLTASAIKNCGIKTTALISNMCASAGFWLASQCDCRIASSETDEIGSIGVLVEVIDRTENDKSRGITRHVITSTDSPDKFPDISTSNGRSKIKARIDDICSVFIARVAAGCGVDEDKVKSDFGKGGVLIARKALAVGMIDEIIEFEKIKYSNFSTPVGADNIKQEDSMDITIEQLKAENPGIYNQIKSEGIAEGQQKERERAAKISGYLGGNYPKAITALLISHIKEGKDSAFADGVVAAYDATLEQKIQDDAVDDTNDIGDTAVIGSTSQSADGSVRTPEDFAAAQKRIK